MIDYKLKVLEKGYLKYLGCDFDIGLNDLTINNLYKVYIDSNNDIYILDDVNDEVLLTDHDVNYKHLCEHRLLYFESVVCN